MSKESESKERAAREARREARAALPAVFIDAWATLTWKGHIRIALGEWLVDEPRYRAAFVMTLEEAKDFAEDLLDRIEARQERDAKATSEGTPPEPETGP